MKNIKRTKSITFILLFILTNFSFAFAQNKWVIVSSASIFDDMAKHIGGDKITSLSIVPVGGDPHKYEATPEDAKILSKANLIFINGLTFEGWINEVIENSGTKAKTITITDGLNPIKSQEHKNAVDPHAWMDAENGLVYIKNIKDALIGLDPANASYYEKNYLTYKNELIALHEYIKQKVSLIPHEKRVLITSHDAFSYFGNKYGLTINAMMGVSTEADAQTSDLKRIIHTIKEKKIPAIFVESTINPKLLQQIAQDNNVSIGGNLYADSVGEKGTEGDSYIGMLKHNAETISKALSGEYQENQEKNPVGKINILLYLFLVLLMLLSWVLLYYKIKK
jgi:ABC-type Zn uptake system ZnuABC Zn-binding protein ZnuA